MLLSLPAFGLFSWLDWILCYWLSAAHKQFLSGLARAEPRWSLLQCQHASALPALRWKLSNLETFRKRRPNDFASQADALDASLGRT